MPHFDHSKISFSIYRAKAVPANDAMLEIMSYMSSKKPSYFQQMRLNRGRPEHAVTTYEFLHKIASHTLFPGLPAEKVDAIADAEDFTIGVDVSPIGVKRKRDSKIRLQLSNPKDYNIFQEGGCGEFIGISKKTLEEQDIPLLANLVVSVNPIDVVYWNKHMDRIKSEDDMRSIIEDTVRRQDFQDKFYM